METYLLSVALIAFGAGFMITAFQRKSESLFRTDFGCRRAARIYISVLLDRSFRNNRGSHCLGAASFP